MARASALHAEGHRFDSDILHQNADLVAQLARASRHVMSGGSSVRLRYPSKQLAIDNEQLTINSSSFINYGVGKRSEDS